jgi:enoyl-CoA hydratase/carnithine racemase
MSYEFVRTEVDGAVGVVTINRPQVRNALNHQTIAELVDALETFDREDAIRCMVLTGDDRAFAAGGTQRWARAAGKVRAMEAVLTGEPVRAVDAERMGLVNRVVPAGAQLDEAKRLAQLIATRPPLAVRLGKEAVNHAMEVGLAPGLEFERKLFYLLFASEDKREGMRAFLEKRPGRFTGR